jgi:ubiquitin thioesterase OTU1
MVVFEGDMVGQVEAAVAKLASVWKKKHKYTDLASFTLKCGVCAKGLVGQKDAQQHALSTGHSQFTEYQ